MRNITGAVAEGDDFFDRSNEMTIFWRDLETDNILLLAPRRVGKTSVMKRMARDSGPYGFSPVFVDVSDCSDETGFVQRLYSAILSNDSGDRLWKLIENSWLGKTIERVQKIGGAGFSLEFRAGGDSWTRLGEELAGALSRLEGRWLIQIDELPVFVLKLLDKDEPADRSRVREFLYWMRRLRQQYAGVRWMLAGSIGLDTVTARLNIADAINDLRIEKLGPFDIPTADALLQALSATHGVRLSAAVRSYIIDRAGWPAPYYLQLLFHELRDIKGEVSEAHVDNAVQELLGPHHSTYFDYWRQRLYEELGRADADYAVTLLHKLCRVPDGALRSTLSLALAGAIPDSAVREDKLRYLLNVLQGDGYLVETNNRWCFLFPLLREYWLRRLAPPEETNG